VSKRRAQITVIDTESGGVKMTTRRVVTPAQAKLLGVLKSHPGSHPAWIAKQLWPDSPGWKRQSNCGPNGSTRGIFMAANAGRLLWALWTLKLADNDFEGAWRITAGGEQALADFQAVGRMMRKRKPKPGGSFHC